LEDSGLGICGSGLGGGSCAWVGGLLLDICVNKQCSANIIKAHCSTSQQLEPMPTLQTPPPPTQPNRQAAWGAVQAYLQLHDTKAAGAGAAAADDASMAGLSAEDRKKERLRRKKEERRVAKEVAEKEAAAEEARKAAEREAASGGKDKGGKKKAARWVGGLRGVGWFLRGWGCF